MSTIIDEQRLTTILTYKDSVKSMKLINLLKHLQIIYKFSFWPNFIYNVKCPVNNTKR